MSADKQKQIRKTLKQYAKEFEVIDSQTSNKASVDEAEKKKSLWKEWKDYVKQCQEQYRAEKDQRIALYGFDPDTILITKNEDLEEIEEQVISSNTE